MLVLSTHINRLKKRLTGSKRSTIGSFFLRSKHRCRAANYHADSEGTMINYAVISKTVSMVRSKRSIDSGWKDRIDEDYKKREKAVII